MKKYKYRFSIFTATYNRADLLPALYDCIKNQDFDKSQFEWVIVSDGSTDNTSNIIHSFIKDNIVNIKFINKENGGKHTAWRTATNIFEGRYVIGADDDDPISYKMLSVFDKYWTELENTPYYEQFWEVKARCRYEDGRLVGMEFPKPFWDSDYIEVDYKLGKGAEMAGCRKIEVLRHEAAVPDHFLFEDKCSNYPEGLRWTAAARKYKTRFVPDIIRTYIVGHESLCFTKKGVKRSEKKNYNSLVGSLYYINEVGDLLRKYTFRRYLITCLQLAYSSLRVKEPILKYIKNPSDKLIVFLCYVPGFIIKMIR